MSQAGAVVPEDARSGLTRWVHRFFYLYMMAVPSLAVLGLTQLTGHPGANVSLLFSSTALAWIVGIAVFIGTLTYIALATELVRPPANNLHTLLLIFDTPVLVFLGALAGGPPELDILAYDGLIEALAAVLALIPIQFTGSIRIPAKSGGDIPKAMLLVLLFGAGPGAVLIALLVGLAQEGSWVGIAAVTIAVAWSTWSYYRLLRYAKSQADNWGWVLIALLIGVLTGIAYGTISANT